MTKSSFIGQKPILEAFHEMNRKGLLGHAYALTGSEGIGKKTLAYELARMLLCYESPEKAPCGQCNACKTLEAGNNPNLIRIAPKTQKILIEQIRVLIDDIGVKPPYGRKVYIIEDADRMTQQAQNCLLKTLEEPPAYAVILMTVSHFASLLMTIRSRVVQIKLSRYTPQEIKEILERKGVKGVDLSSVISFSEGIAGKAITLAQNAGFKALREMVLRFIFNEGEATGDHLALNQYLSQNKEAMTDCLAIMEAVYRDTAFILSGKTDGLINSDKRDNIIAYAQRHSFREISEKMALIDQIRGHLSNYMNYQLAVDMITLS